MNSARRARARVIQELVKGPLEPVMGTEVKMRLHNGEPLTCEAGLEGMKTRSMTKMLAESPV